MEQPLTAESAYALLWESPKVKLTKKTGMPPGAGLYAVWSDNVLTYVGISTSLRGRWYSHEGFARIVAGCANPDLSWVLMDIDDAKNLEAILIRTFKPKLNRSGNPDWTKEGRHSVRTARPIKDISVRIDDVMFEKLENLAAKADRSVSGYVRMMIKEDLAQVAHAKKKAPITA